MGIRGVRENYGITMGKVLQLTQLSPNVHELSVGDDHLRILFSYNVPVAFKQLGVYTRINKTNIPSSTTARHITQWIGSAPANPPICVSQDQFDELLADAIGWHI